MLEELKDRVLLVAQKAQREGLCKHKSGNFSMRDEKTGYLVITPTGADRERLSVDDMVVMNMDAMVVENKTCLRPTSEALVHIRAYALRPELRAVAHTHSMYATTFAVLAKPIPAIIYELSHLNCKKARIPVARYGRPGTPALADSIVEPLQEADVLLMQGHGAMAVDASSIEEAYLKAAYIEELAEMYHHALTAGNGIEPPVFSTEELQKWEYPKEIQFSHQQ